jgi:protein required for attachment to host cells
MTVSIPKNTLIVVTDGEKAHMYRNTSDAGIKIESLGPVEKATYENFDGAARTPVETSPHHQDEATFAHHVANDIYNRVHADESHKVVLIADPRTLGEIRPILRKEVTSRIICELHKDLTNSSIADIEKSLKAHAA